MERKKNDPRIPQLAEAFNRLGSQNLGKAPLELYPYLIGAAILTGNGLMSDMTAADVKLFAGMVCDVYDVTYGQDEPRFTLYDYLDACVNGTEDWRDVAKDIKASLDAGYDDTTFSCLVARAVHKRQTYSDGRDG